MKFLKLFCILILGLSMVSCSLRRGEGEDIHLANEKEKKQFINNLTYEKDYHGICYAILNNHTADYRSTFTFAVVDCEKVNL